MLRRVERRKRRVLCLAEHGQGFRSVLRSQHDPGYMARQELASGGLAHGSGKAQSRMPDQFVFGTASVDCARWCQLWPESMEVLHRLGFTGLTKCNF